MTIRSVLSKAKRRILQLKNIPLIYGFRILGLHRNANHWVIFERGTDARDNGYFFYRYMKKHHPEQKIYYIITRDSADLPRVAEDAVYFGSLRHYWAVATAKKILSTHCYFGLPHLNAKVYRFCRLHKRFYILSHGILHNNVSNLHYTQTKARLYICGAEPERRFAQNGFGYPETVARYTGFARYDSLHDSVTKSQILIMPTWRSTIHSEEEFLASEYYKQWQMFISDQRLHEALQNQNLQAIFYPHYEIQKYLHHFNPGNPTVTLAGFDTYDVQTLLKESKLLVTDYSSVFFDFAYMGKPVIYFQFDTNNFRSGHYGEAYFSYENMGFGPVCLKEENAIQETINAINAGFLTNPTYENRIKAFFPLRDRHNNERIYTAIIQQE